MSDATGSKTPNIVRVALALTVLASAYLAFRELGRSGAFGLDPELLKLVLWVGIPLVAAIGFSLVDRRSILAQTGLSNLNPSALLPGIAAGVVMAGILCVVYERAPGTLQLPHLFNKGVAAPISEEFLFRGFVVTQLLLAGLRARTSILIAALAFGAAHIPNVLNSGMPSTIALEFAITALGGAYFGLIMIWAGGSVLAPIGLHMTMNLVWEIFSISQTAIGDEAGTVARGGAIAASLAVAWLLRRRIAGAAPANGSAPSH